MTSVADDVYSIVSFEGIRVVPVAVESSSP